MNPKDTIPLQESIHVLLQEIEPSSTFVDIRAIGNETANGSFLLDAKTAAGTPFSAVIKRYVDYSGNCEEKALLEFKTLAMLQKHDVPAPPPLFVDEKGAIFGAPTLVTGFVAGESIWTSPDPLPYARSLGQTLAQIHSIPCDADAATFLRNAELEGLWFTRKGEMPDYMGNHPDGPMVWDTVQELRTNIKPVPPSLVHVDYWMGNVLWHGQQVAAVIDWEEASYGDPNFDLGYCRMDMFLSGMGKAAADELLTVYEAEMGRPAQNLALWELAAAPRPMHSPSWLADVDKELREFIANIEIP